MKKHPIPVLLALLLEALEVFAAHHAHDPLTVIQPDDGDLVHLVDQFSDAGGGLARQADLLHAMGHELARQAGALDARRLSQWIKSQLHDI